MASGLMSLSERVAALSRASGSGLCVGIDPEITVARQLAAAWGKDVHRADGAYLLQWLAEELLAAACAEGIAFIKLQMAYFECYGAQGFAALESVIRRARSQGIWVILDGKRGDISSTMHAYGTMAFEALEADALTINPYMGADVWSALTPWLTAGKYAFVVWWTSQARGSDVQRRCHGSGEDLVHFLPSYIQRTAEKQGIDQALGLVMGAAQIPHLSADLMQRIACRALLIPGVGAQGGPYHSQGAFRRCPHHLWPLSRGLLQPHKSAANLTFGDLLKENISHWKNQFSVV